MNEHENRAYQDELLMKELKKQSRLYSWVHKEKQFIWDSINVFKNLLHTIFVLTVFLLLCQMAAEFFGG